MGVLSEGPYHSVGTPGRVRWGLRCQCLADCFVSKGVVGQGFAQLVVEDQAFAEAEGFLRV